MRGAPYLRPLAFVLVIWIIFALYAYAWESTGEGKILVSSVPVILARIDSYSPSDSNNPVKVEVGKSTPISVTFTNTGDTNWNFIARATIWDSNNNIVSIYEKELDSPLQPNSQTTVRWDHTVNRTGLYSVQVTILKSKQFSAENVLDLTPTLQTLINGTDTPQAKVLTVSSPTIGSFSLTVPPKGKATTSISVYNPNSFPIKVTGFQVIYNSGFYGDLTATNLPLEIEAYGTKYVQLNFVDYGSSYTNYAVKFKLSGTP